MRRRPDPNIVARVLALLQEEAQADDRGSVTATYVSRRLSIGGPDAILALDAIARLRLVNVVYHDVCEASHVNENVIENGTDGTGIGFCPRCGRDVEHQRSVIYRFNKALAERSRDPKSTRRRAPQYRHRLSMSATN